MTMLSFRVDDMRGRGRSACGRIASASTGPSFFATRSTATSFASHPRSTPSVGRRCRITDDELSLAAIADWGPAEDWSDWADAAR